VVLDIADNGLVRVDRDVLDRDLLLASAAVVIKSLCDMTTVRCALSAS